LPLAPWDEAANRLFNISNGEASNEISVLDGGTLARKGRDQNGWRTQTGSAIDPRSGPPLTSSAATIRTCTSTAQRTLKSAFHASTSTISLPGIVVDSATGMVFCFVCKEGETTGLPASNLKEGWPFCYLGVAHPINSGKRFQSRCFIKIYAHTIDH